MKVGDWIRPRDVKLHDQVYQVGSIELEIDEMYLQKTGNKILAAMPLVRLDAPDGATYSGTTTQSPADFEITGKPGGLWRRRQTKIVHG